MAIKKCVICGGDFETGGNGAVCDSCKDSLACCVCGKHIPFKPYKMKEFKQRGWVTCSNKCGQIKRTREAGVNNIAQLYDNRKEKACAICGKTFMAKPNQTVCDECHIVECCVCGKQMKLDARQLGTYLNRGWITCSVVCGSRMARKTCKERYGVANVSQTEEVREAISLARKNESKETKRKRSESLKESCGNEAVKSKIINTRRNKNGGMLQYERVAEFCSRNPHAYFDEVAKALGMTLTGVYNIIEDHPEIVLPRRRVSVKEQEVADFLDSLGVECVRHERKILGGKELDFYCPNENVAIEVNDFATHNSTSNPFGSDVKPKDYHYEKTVECRKNGIRLIHAWEHCLPDWCGDSGNIGSWNVLKDVIVHALGKTEHTVYARNTKVVEFPAIATKGFFSGNNINGYRSANTTYALVPKGVDSPTVDDIIMAYAVGRAHFGKGKYDAEIARGACRLGWRVVGGASKLWRYIIDNTDYESIVYYVDLNYYTASSMGFLDDVEYMGHSDSFWNYWVCEDRLANREPSKHKEIVAGYADGSILQVYNAGTDVYVWHRSPHNKHI